MRSILKTLILAPALVIATGCKNDKPADPALNNDLSLAAQANPNARLDSISAAERMNAAAPAPASNLRSSPAPVASAPARRSSSSSTRRSTSSGSSAGSSSGSTVASEPRVVTKKNTKRDAAIGAAAGAIIGGATTKSVKGGIIGSAAGGILGGVIGNNVDIQKKRAP
jgi:cobalamin biosynthesis Mg chelatase CobN